MLSLISETLLCPSCLYRVIRPTYQITIFDITAIRYVFHDTHSSANDLQIKPLSSNTLGLSHTHHLEMITAENDCLPFHAFQCTLALAQHEERLLAFRNALKCLIKKKRLAKKKGSCRLALALAWLSVMIGFSMNAKCFFPSIFMSISYCIYS